VAVRHQSGVAFGAGLHEARIALPRWIVASEESETHWNAEAAREDNTGIRFWAFVTTVPLSLFTLANLVAAWRAPDPVRQWWLAASLTALADRILTGSYFIPTMVALMAAPDSPESVASAVLWQNLNYLRLAILLAAWVAALKAFSLTYQHRSAT
jgi:hypothetical protein